MAGYVFLTLLGGGMVGVLSLCRVEQMAWKFLRLVGAISTALLTFVIVGSVLSPKDAAAATNPTSERVALGLTVIGAMATVVLLTLAPLGERVAVGLRWVCAVGGLAATAAGCAWWLGGDAWPTLSMANLVGIVGVFGLDAFLLGSVTVAWLLGHAYLTATKMTVEPLRRLSGLFTLAAAARISFLALSLSWAYLSGADDVAAEMTSHGILLSLCLLAGIVATVVFALMVRSCVRLRSTQSATGLLYFASVLTYMGVLSGHALSAECGWAM